MKSRIEWIDLVKASSVLLVVFMHASNTLVDLGGPTWVTTALLTFNHLVEPLRMPVFFLVSGMLAASAVHRPWRASTNRTLGMVYLYVVWMLVFFGFTALLGASHSDPLGSILFAKSGYWYLYAMALFFVIARLLRNQPAWAVVAGALVLNLLRPFTDEFFGGLVPGSLYTSMTMNLGFFLMGAYFKDLVGDVAARTRWPHTIVLGVLSAGAGWIWLYTPEAIGQSYLPLSILWVAFGVSLAVQITRDGAPGWARYVGARTLPIYVVQWPVLFVVALIPGSFLTAIWVQAVFPLVVTGGVAALALGLHNLPLAKTLFTAPEWVTEPHSVLARSAAATPVSVTAGR